jgi:hypothetical protein
VAKGRPGVGDGLNEGGLHPDASVWSPHSELLTKRSYYWYWYTLNSVGEMIVPRVVAIGTERRRGTCLILAVSCVAEVTTEHVYLALITPSDELNDDYETPCL